MCGACSELPFLKFCAMVTYKSRMDDLKYAWKQQCAGNMLNSHQNLKLKKYIASDPLQLNVAPRCEPLLLQPIYENH
jgi:hypothetical protein